MFPTPENYTDTSGTLCLYQSYIVVFPTHQVVFSGFHPTQNSGISSFLARRAVPHIRVHFVFDLQSDSLSNSNQMTFWLVILRYKQKQMVTFQFWGSWMDSTKSALPWICSQRLMKGQNFFLFHGRCIFMVNKSGQCG